MKKSEIILFETKDKEVTLSVPMDGDTVWLSQAQMTELFNVDRTVITRHVNNIFKEKELIRESNVQKMHIANADRPVQFYALDVIISVGYRVKSKRGIEFRQWASKILKQYMIDGYAINEKRLHALQKTVDIQTRMLADALNVEEKDILKAVNIMDPSPDRTCWSEHRPGLVGSHQISACKDEEGTSYRSFGSILSQAGCTACRVRNRNRHPGTAEWY